MKNSMTIGGVCRQLAKVCERIDTMTMDMESFESNASEDVLETFKEHRLDALAHVQELTLILTSLVTEAQAEATANADDSAFMEGELNSTKPEVVAPEEGVKA